MKMNLRIKEVPLLLGILVIGITLVGGCAEETTAVRTIEDISVKQAYDLMEKNKDNPSFLIIDVRTPGEFASGYIESALNIDYYSQNFREELNELDKGKTYLIYCRSGNRSGKALSMMKELAFREVYNMLGGIVQWKAEDLPTMTMKELATLSS